MWTVRAAVGALALGLAGTAAAKEPPRRPGKDGVVSIAAVKGSLVILRTSRGHYVVVEPFAVGSKHFYFGDGKRLYRQRTLGGSAEGKRAFERHFWSPRVDNRGYLRFRDGAWTLSCKDREAPLVEVSGEESAALLAKATFFEPLWKRRSYALARDDRGRYYYVDRLLDEHGGKGHRLFVGLKGAMKKTRLVNVVSDSEGDIFSTKKGDLRLIWNRGETEKVTWVRRGERTPLTPVPLWKNVVLVYDELGVYDGEVLGEPCDHY